jgi:ribosomal protein L3 glutamine methyltransferase
MSDAGAAPPELLTVRDFLRFAVSRFRAASLAHGHGASSALDEAAFLILETLHLPVDDISPWLDAKLTRAERNSLAKIIALRIKTRMPAAYLLQRTYMHGVPFYIDVRAIVPRSYIGELLFSDLFGGGESSLIGNPDEVRSVLDLCTGSGCLAILAAGIFPNAEIDAADLSGDALDVARVNLEQHGLSNRINLFEGDLFKPLQRRRYNLILANPPYVAAAEMAAFPPEYAHEPAIAHAGGSDGLDIVRRILAEAPHHLNETGGLLCEIGTGREILAAEFPRLDFLWLDTEQSAGEVFWLPREAFSA